MLLLHILPAGATAAATANTTATTTAATITTTAAQLLGFLLQIRVCEVEPASVGVG